MNVFEAVKQSVTIRQAASFYGIRVGRNSMVCCPFHNDRTPSMKVDSRFYCFGCGASGDVIDFAALLHGLGKREAAVRLAEDFGVSYENSIRPTAAGCHLASSFCGSIAEDKLHRIPFGYFVIRRNRRKSGIDLRTGKGGAAA